MFQYGSSMDPPDVLIFLCQNLQHLDVDDANDVGGRCLQIECLKACFSGFRSLFSYYWTWPGRVSKEKEAKDRKGWVERDTLRFGLPTCCYNIISGYMLWIWNFWTLHGWCPSIPRKMKVKNRISEIQTQMSALSRCDTRKTFYRSDCRLRYGYRGRPNLWRKTKKLWDRRHGFLAASKEALTPLDLCLFVKPPNLTSQKFHQHPCTLRLLLVWECSWSHLQTILKLKRDIVESSVLDVLRCFW